MNPVYEKSFIARYSWTIPFLCVFAGYLTVKFLTPHRFVTMPQLIGTSLHEGLALVAPLQLNVRLLTQKENIHVKEGTIISQTPTVGQSIKPHQTVYLVTTKHPGKQKALCIVGMNSEEAKKLLTAKKIPYKLYPVSSEQKTNTCVAQIPSEGTQLTDAGMILYYSHTTCSDLVIVPSFVGKTMEEVIPFLARYEIQPQVFHTHSHTGHAQCTDCIIKEQRPLAGTLIDLHKPLSVQLKV